MNVVVSSSPVMALALALTLFSPARLTQAALAKPSSVPAVSNNTPRAAEMQIPRSTFVEGRDPFSSRSNIGPGGRPPPIDLSGGSGIVLNGVSGTPDHRLVIINNRTFAIGEEGVIILPGGAKARIKCEAIGDASAVISVAGRPRMELSLRGGL